MDRGKERVTEKRKVGREGRRDNRGRRVGRGKSNNLHVKR